MATRIEPLLTVADLDVLPDDGNRYELIEGELFVSSAPSLTHQLIVANLVAMFREYLANQPIGVVVPGPGVIFSERSGVIPDVVFIRNERRDEIASGDRIYGAPDIVIEIVSPGHENEQRDRVVKRQLYGKYGVGEYWVVDPQQRNVEIYRSGAHGLALAATLTDGEMITSPLLPAFERVVREVFRM